MFSSKLNSKLIYDLSYNKNKISYRHKILYNENFLLSKALNYEKNKIDFFYNNDSKLWDYLKKFSNEYEFIYTNSFANFKNISKIYPISRSYFKLWEILHDFNLINIDPEESFISCHLAEGPGGFIECIYKYILKYFTNNFKNIKIYGSTLLSDNINIPKWKIKKNIQEKFNIVLNLSSNENGNLYNITEVNKIINKIGINQCNFITADGGFDFSQNYNDQEKNFINLLISEVYIMLNVLKNNGNGLIKIYDIYCKNTIKILYIISLFFEKIYIVKPLTSRPANSEKYILCNNFKKNKKYEIFLQIFRNVIENNNLDYLNNNNIIIEYNFITKILIYNKWYTDRQVNYINKTIMYIHKYNKNDDKYFLQNIYNNNKKMCIDWCNKYNIF